MRLNTAECSRARALSSAGWADKDTDSASRAAHIEVAAGAERGHRSVPLEHTPPQPHHRRLVPEADHPPTRGRFREGSRNLPPTLSLHR